MSDHYEPGLSSDPGLFGAVARRGFSRPSSTSTTYRTPWDDPDPCDTDAGEEAFIRRHMAARDEAAVAREEAMFERLVADHNAPEGRTA